MYLFFLVINQYSLAPINNKQLSNITFHLYSYNYIRYMSRINAFKKTLLVDLEIIKKQ